MIRLYLDEDTLSAALIRALQNADLDVLTVAQADRLGMPDETQLHWATECGRVLYSFNVGDFAACIVISSLRGRIMLALSWPHNGNIRSGSKCVDY